MIKWFKYKNQEGIIFYEDYFYKRAVIRPIYMADRGEDRPDETVWRRSRATADVYHFCPLLTHG